MAAMTTPPGGPPDAAGRIAFFDAMRSVVIVIMVVFHVALAYMATGSHQWLVEDEARNLVFDVFARVADIFMMAALFLNVRGSS